MPVQLQKNDGMPQNLDPAHCLRSLDGANSYPDEQAGGERPMQINHQNALALEYQREYGTARRYVDITNPGDYPLVGRIGRVFGPGFFEELGSFCRVYVGSVGLYCHDRLLRSSYIR